MFVNSEIPLSDMNWWSLHLFFCFTTPCLCSSSRHTPSHWIIHSLKRKRHLSYFQVRKKVGQSEETVLFPWENGQLFWISPCRKWTASSVEWKRSLLWKSWSLLQWDLGDHLWWFLGPEWCPRGVQAAGLWSGPRSHGLCSLWTRIRTHLAEWAQLLWKWIPSRGVPFPPLGSAWLQTQRGCGNSLLRSGLHTSQWQGGTNGSTEVVRRRDQWEKELIQTGRMTSCPNQSPP